MRSIDGYFNHGFQPVEKTLKKGQKNRRFDPYSITI